MAVPFLELEGTEIAKRLSDYADQKLRILVFPPDEHAAGKDTRPIADVLAEIASGIPVQEVAQLPAGFTDQLDHYLYGSPKQ